MADNYDSVITVLVHLRGTRMLEKSDTVRIKQVYVHLKSGNLYFVDSITTGTEDEEVYVNYYALYSACKSWSRPIDLFLNNFRRLIIDKEA